MTSPRRVRAAPLSREERGSPNPTSNCETQHLAAQAALDREVQFDGAGEPEAAEEVGTEGVAGPVRAEVDAGRADEDDEQAEERQEEGAQDAAAPAGEDNVEAVADDVPHDVDECVAGARALDEATNLAAGEDGKQRGADADERRAPFAGE